MNKSKDESNRISRLSSVEAKAYLSQLKGKTYDEYRKKWEQCGSEQIDCGMPLQLNIELTANCNLRCKMCYRNYDIKVREGTLSVDDVMLLVKQFSEMQIPSLWLSGGEPLLHPNIQEILRAFALVKPVDYWMVTNGLLLSEEIAETVVDAGLTWLSISIDASTADTYKKIRGGDYQSLLNNIDQFLAIRAEKGSKLPFLRVSFINMEENKGEETSFIEYWKDKADIIDIQTLADYHDLDQFTKEDVLNAQYKCTAPFTLVSVLPNGDIIPCCNGFYGEKSRFNIHNITLKEYWASEYHTKFANSIKQKKYSKECIDCIKSFIPRKRQESDCAETNL